MVMLILFLSPFQLGPETEVRLMDGLQKLSTFQLHFVQETYSDFLDSTVAEGDLVVARPGRMRMTYRKGDRKVIIWDGEMAYERDQMADTESRQPIGDMREEPLVQILLYGSNLKDFFLIDRIEMDDHKVFRLRPRKESDYHVILELNSQNLPSVLEVAGQDGEGTRFHFTDIQLNPELDKDTFQIPAEKP